MRTGSGGIGMMAEMGRWRSWDGGGVMAQSTARPVTVLYEKLPSHNSIISFTRTCCPTHLCRSGPLAGEKVRITLSRPPIQAMLMIAILLHISDTVAVFFVSMEAPDLR